MKFYETHYEEYLSSLEKYNLHPEKKEIYRAFSQNIKKVPNLLFYGPTGVGKYSQVLSFLKRYSPSQLKYEKKMEFETDKLKYNYKISDIHYEIDMSLLGCNSKVLWHEVFSQIIDIVSNNMKLEKMAFVVCKNFHCIHAELLNIFYSYIQQHRDLTTSSIFIRFILITEHIGFIPKNIVESCHIVSFSRPSTAQYLECIPFPETSAKILHSMDSHQIVNIKEIKSFRLIHSAQQLPPDIFNTVCDQLIHEIRHSNPINYMILREKLYDIMVYNLDATECLWNILSSLMPLLTPSDISDIIDKMYVFLKYYNNNYRPIYHLESIVFTIITKLHG
jgi:hypothetical protein